MRDHYCQFLKSSEYTKVILIANRATYKFFINSGIEIADTAAISKLSNF